MLKNLVIPSMFGILLVASNEPFNENIFDLTLEDLQNIVITSASKRAERVIDAPARMVIITKEQIQNRGFKSLDELLNSLSGFNVLNYNNSGYYNSVVVRGLNGSNYFKILQDGIEIDQATGEVLGVGMNFPLFGVKRVEVLYGPASVIYGADAISGVINIITDDSEAIEGVVNYGDAGYKNYNFRFAKKYNNTLLSIKGHFQDDQNYHFSSTYPELFGSEIKYNGEIIASKDRNYDIAPNQSKSLNLYLKNENITAGANYSYLRSSTSMATKSTGTLFEDKANYYTELKSIYLTYNSELFDEYRTATTISYGSSEVDPKSYFKNGYTGYKEAYKYSLGERYALEEIISKSFESHELLLGASITRFHSIPLTYDLPDRYNTNKDTSEQGYTYPSTDIPINYYETYWTNTAIFAQDQIEITERLRLSIAGRYDFNSAYDNSFNPRIALVYNPNDSTTHKLIYATAYLAPSTYNKYKHYGTFSINDMENDSNPYKASGMRVPNENLKAERSKGLEYNIQKWIDKSFMVDVSIFYNEIKNLLTDRTIENDTTSFPLVTISSAKQNINSGEGQMYGAEIYFDKKVTLDRFKLNFWGNYSYLNGNIDIDTKSELPLITNQKVNLGFTFIADRLLITPSIEWVDAYKTANLVRDSNSRTELKGVLTGNLYASYRFSKNLESTLFIRNISNKKYYHPRESASSYELSQQPERLAVIGLKFKF